MSKRTHYSRLFLNQEEHGGIALVESTIEEIGQGRDGSKHFEASLTIGDCNRTVTLDFSVYSSERADEHRQKITRLRRAIVAFEKVLIAQLDEVSKGQS